MVFSSCSSVQYVTSSTAVTVDIRAVPLMHKVMGGSVCLYWIGNVMRSSCRMLKIYRRFEGSQSLHFQGQALREEADFCCSCASCIRLWRPQNLAKRLYIFISRNGLASLKTSRLESFRVQNGCTTWHWEASGRLSQCRALHSLWSSPVLLFCNTPFRTQFPDTSAWLQLHSSRYAFPGEMPSWGSVPAAWCVRFWKSWYS